MKLAWFSPWPPDRSGIAGRSAELVPALARRGHAIDVFVDAARQRPAAVAAEPPSAAAVRVMTAHDFVWRQAAGHYDLAVYQVGNSQLHRYIWPYLVRFPGLSVLHDARVHHARAEALLYSGRSDDYRAEFRWNNPEVDPAAAELAIMQVDGPFFYRWPMLRVVLETSRLIAPHSRGVAAQLQRDYPNRPIEHIALGEGAASLDLPRARREFRDAHGLPADAIVFGVFGGITAEKRVLEILAAFHDVRAYLPDARLILAGTADWWLDVGGRIDALKLAGAVHHFPTLPDEAFDHAIAAADVTLSLRWPSALETSGPWVRSLALGRATIIMDLPHQTHVPALDPRTWKPVTPSPDLAAGAGQRAITVALDTRDYRHSLRLAMRRLGQDAALRDRLGQAAREYWRQEHTLDRMIADYERAMTRALHEPAPRPAPDWPPHLRPDPGGHARTLLADGFLADASTSSRLTGLFG